MTTAHVNASGSQFSLLSLFEYTTICCILASLAGPIGVPSALCLMLFALGLFLRQGWLAIAMLAASFVASVSLPTSTTFLREFAIITVAGLICAWFIYRRRAVAPVF